MAVNVQSSSASRRLNRWPLWIGSAVLVAGVVALLITFVGNTANEPSKNPTGPAVKFTPPQKQIPFPNEAWTVAKEFFATAVARTDMTRSWQLSDPTMRGGLTFKQWKTGTITVPFYPVGHAVKINWKNTNYAYPREAMVNVVLVAKAGSSQKPLTAQIVLRKFGNGANARWLVDHFQPLGGPPVPAP